jgi:spermidine synthase
MRVRVPRTSTNRGLERRRTTVWFADSSELGSVRSPLKPQRKLAETTTPDRALLTLHAHDKWFSVRLQGKELMNSAAAESELQLGASGVASIANRSEPRVLIGGLGLGFTLHSALEALPKRAKVEVVELIPQVVEWNRTHLLDLNGWRLNDPRVSVLLENVASVITRAHPRTYDAIILDVDNGPVAMVDAANSRLYGSHGIRALARALTPGGRIAVWSASADAKFSARLTQQGFEVRAVPSRLHAGARRSTYMLYFGDAPALQRLRAPHPGNDRRSR